MVLEANKKCTTKERIMCVRRGRRYGNVGFRWDPAKHDNLLSWKFKRNCHFPFYNNKIIYKVYTYLHLLDGLDYKRIFQKYNIQYSYSEATEVEFLTKYFYKSNIIYQTRRISRYIQIGMWLNRIFESLILIQRTKWFDI